MPSGESDPIDPSTSAAPRPSVPDRIRHRLAERRLAAVQLFRLIAHAGGRLVLGTVVVHAVAGAMPIVFLVGIGQGLHALVAGTSTVVAVTAALAAFTVQQLLAPGQLVLSQAVARRVDGYCSTRVVRHALVDAPLRALESTEVADELHETIESLSFQRLTPGMAAEGALALVARYTQLAGAVAVLATTAGPWVAVLGAGVALVSRFGQTEAFHQWGVVIGRLRPARRRASYVRDLGAGTSAAKEVRTLGLVDWLDRRFTSETEAALRPLWGLRRRIYGGPFAVYALIGLVGAAGALVLLARQGGTSGDDVARLTMAVQAAVLCVRFGVMFPETDVKLVYGRAAWQSMLRAEELVRQVADEVPGTRPAPVPEQQIELRELRFGYRPDQAVLDGLDLHIPAGRSLAVVGVNGAGKTTLVKLLTGLYRPTGGAIVADAVDLLEVDPVAWQARFAVTFQDFVRYQLSLRENVAMNAVAWRDDDAGLLDSLQRAGLGDVVNGLAEGLDTPLNRLLPGGRDLSGGQWQRVALARALFAVRHGATVLVLDEPTAALDARGEAEFYDTFLDLTRGVTSLVISHRFSTVRRADRIVVLDGGHITEQGTHDELVQLGGHYARMFAAQARRFAETAVEAPADNGSRTANEVRTVGGGGVRA